jgi:hypothetical protein
VAVKVTVSPRVIVPAEEVTVVVVAARLRAAGLTTCPPVSDPLLLLKFPSALT